MNNATNKITCKLNEILLEYSRLPEYSEMDTPTIDTKSLFGNYPINIAATRGLINEISTLLDNNADINAKGEHGYSPLHDAVEQGHLEIVIFLVDQGADITFKNTDGDTPIDLSLLLGENNIHRFLLSKIT